MTPSEARLSALVVTVRALCRALLPEVARDAATGPHLEQATFDSGGVDADTADAGDLRAVLGALGQR